MNVRLESEKMGYQEDKQNKTVTDEGNNDYLYEVGSNLAVFLDNENFLKDGDMEKADLVSWANYNTVSLKEKTLSDKASGQRSLHLITPGSSSYEGTMQSFSVSVSDIKKLFVQMTLKMAPGKEMNFNCICSNLDCCRYFVFGGEDNNDWVRYTRIVDVSADSTIYNSYYSDTSSEFWLDDLIIRPIY
ncbi:MAG: hypothetical protein PHH27_03210 [Candidatus Colwellbacteria bacterium]|nr:hypothetical protein [Candidatus Colwellbacteria bacterium]